MPQADGIGDAFVAGSGDGFEAKVALDVEVPVASTVRLSMSIPSSEARLAMRSTSHAASAPRRTFIELGPPVPPMDRAGSPDANDTSA